MTKVVALSNGIAQAGNQPRITTDSVAYCKNKTAQLEPV